MAIHTRKNSVIGYLAVKALQRELDRRRKSRRSGLKVAAYVGLGLVSAGILAAVVAIALRRRHADAPAADASEPEIEIVGEYVEAPETVSAT